MTSLVVPEVRGSPHRMSLIDTKEVCITNMIILVKLADGDAFLIVVRSGTKYGRD